MTDLSKATQYCEIICSELNVKALVLGNSAVKVKFEHDTLRDKPIGLDVYVNGVPQNKPHLAAQIVLTKLKN